MLQQNNTKNSHCKMTPTEREIAKKKQKAIKIELSAKLQHGDLTALAEAGQYHYNTYRIFLDTENDFWSDGVHQEVVNYFETKEKAIAEA